jgi:CBF/Mak21 family
MPPLDEIKRVGQLDKALQTEGLRATKALEELNGLLTSSRSGVAAAAAHAVRRALPKLKRTAKAAANPTVSDWIEAQEILYVRRLAEAITSSPACSNEDTEDVRAVLVCAAVTSDVCWKTVVRAATLSGKTGLLKTLVKRYADLRILALQLVLDGLTASGTGSAAAIEPLSEPKTFPLDRYKLLVVCSNGDPELESVRQLGGHDKPPAVAGFKRNRSTRDCEHDESKPQPFGNAKALRKVYGDAWVSVLSDVGLGPVQLRECLARLPHDVIPKMSNPLRLADVLTDAYNNSLDVNIAMSALDGLFALVSNHKLDYPLFYPKLYALLRPDALFFAPDRERFLNLVGMFLTRGAYLPRGMVAAFVKRLVRRAVTAPPAGALWCMRLALELLQRHPSVSFLVHNSVNLFETTSSALKVQQLGGPDPYDDSELDPQESRADMSSLWELETLRSHLCPAVSRLAEAFSKDFRKAPLPPSELNDHASWTFDDLFASEFRRNAKTVPLAYEFPDVAQLNSKLSPFISWSS